MSIVSYVRISKEQGADPTSIQNQKRNCQQKALEMFDTDISMVFEEEGKTGADLNRPELQRLFQLVESGGVSAIFINTVDRLSRDMTDVLIARRRFLKAGTLVYAVKDQLEVTSDDDVDQFRVAIGGWQGQVERRKITDTLQGGRLEKIRRGEWGCGGSAPFGYKIIRNDLEDGSREVFLVENEEESAIVRRIFDMYLERRMSVVDIAFALNSEGVPSPYQRRRNRSSKRWHESTIAHMLENATYIGEHQYRLKSGETFIVPVPSLISPEQHQRAVERKQSRHLVRRRKNLYLLNPIVKCARCGRRYVGVTGSHNWRGYGCTGHLHWKAHRLVEPCSNSNIQGDLLEDEVWNNIVQFVNTGDVLATSAAELFDVNEVQRQAEITVLQSALIARDDTEARLLLKWAEIRENDEANDRAFELAMERLNQERDDLHRRIIALESAQEHIGFLRGLSARLEELKGIVSDGLLPFEIKQGIVHELLDRIEIDGDEVTVYYAGFDFIRNSDTIQRTVSIKT